MKLRRKNEGGMTLVELLAAITILGIVFIGLLSVFPQMTNSNKQTEEKLETMNLARIKLVELTESPQILCHSPYEIVNPNNDPLTYESKEDDYHYYIDYYLHDVLDENTNNTFDICSDIIDNENGLEPAKLNEIHIKVFSEGRLVSETFGYINSRSLQSGQRGD